MTRPNWTREELDGVDVEWIVDLAFAGRIVRVATRALTLSSAAGDLQYDGTLTRPMWKRGLSLFSRNPEQEQIPLDFVVPLDVAGLCAAGHRLVFSPVSVAQVRVRNGVAIDTWEERYVALTGRAQSCRYGIRGYNEAIGTTSIVFITAARPAWDSPGLIPLASHEVSGATWDPRELATEDLSVAYTTVFGYPGKDPMSPIGFITAGIVFWTRKITSFHVAGIALGKIDAATVTLNNDDDYYGQVVNVSQEYEDGGGLVPARDARGTLLTVVDYATEGYDSSLPASYRPAVADTTRVYIAWHDGGGMLKPGGGVLRGAGDVLLYMLERTGLPVDYAAAKTAAPALNAYLIDCVIDAHIKPMDWLLEHLLPLLPVTIVATERGLAPLVWLHTAGRQDAVMHIDADLDPTIAIGDTVSEEEEETADVRNLYSMEYGYSRRVGTFQRTARLGPKAIPSTEHAEHLLLNIPTGAGTRRVAIRAVLPGQAGVGIRITVANTGSESYTEDVDAKLAVVTIDGTGWGSTTTTDSLVALIETGTLLTASCSDDDGPESWLDTANSGIRTLIADWGTRPSALCATSQRLMAQADRPGADAGIRQEELSSRILYDHGTAARVLEWRAAAYALPPRRLDLMGPPATFAGLSLGDYVTVTSTPHAFDRVLGVVEEIDTDGVTTGIRVVFMEAHRHAV